MMRHIFFSAFLLVFSFRAYAQNSFAPVGAEWWYYVNADMLNNDHYKLDHALAESDTVILGANCTKVVTERQLRNKLSPQNLILSQDSTLYFYSSNDTVFVFNKVFNRFTPLYIFSAQVGDTICLPIPPSPQPDLRINPYTGDTSFCFVIDSIKLELYDTSHLRTFYTRSIEDFSQNSSIGAYPSYNWGHLSGKYIERIGGQYGMLPEHGHNLADFSWRTLGASGNFRCYSDTQHNIKMISIPCDSMTYTSLSINEYKHDDNVAIYPNPSSGHFIIESKQPFAANVSVLITDISGRKIKGMIIPAGENKFDFTLNVQAGIYLLILNTAENCKYYRKLSLQP